MRRHLTAMAFLAMTPPLAAMPFAPAMAAKSTVPATIQPSPDPDPSNPEKTYEFCMQLSQQRADQAIELAGKWIALGGGEAAHHCRAMALIGLKDYGAAASELEDTAQKSRSDPALRADLLEQAGQAWSLEGELTHAYNAQTAGIKIAPDGSPQKIVLLVDRAAVLAEGEKYKEAMDDLNAVLALKPDHSDALAFRASAHRHLGEMDLAMADAQHAVTSDGKNVNGLLERATIYKARGQVNEARRDWILIAELAPGSDAAKAAQDNLQQADMKP